MMNEVYLGGLKSFVISIFSSKIWKIVSVLFKTQRPILKCFKSLMLLIIILVILQPICCIILVWEHPDCLVFSPFNMSAKTREIHVEWEMDSWLNAKFAKLVEMFNKMLTMFAVDQALHCSPSTQWIKPQSFHKSLSSQKAKQALTGNTFLWMNARVTCTCSK